MCKNINKCINNFYKIGGVYTHRLASVTPPIYIYLLFYVNLPLKNLKCHILRVFGKYSNNSLWGEGGGIQQIPTISLFTPATNPLHLPQILLKIKQKLANYTLHLPIHHLLI